MTHFKRRKSFFQTQVKPVTPEELMFAMSLGEAGATQQMPMQSPEQFGVTLDDGDGKSTEIRFTDRPYNRAMLAIKQHCGDDSDKFFSLMCRIQAFASVTRKPQLERWMRDDGPDSRERGVHMAVIDAASTLPLQRNGCFNVGEFCRAVEKLAAEKYPDIESKP